MKVKWSIIERALFLVMIAFSLWFRTTSLERMPDVDPDETWHAVQLTKMLRGESCTLVTETGLPLSPIHASLELPLLMMFGPTTAILRIPTVFTGILTILLAFVLGSKALDRTTAIIATGLIAVLPVATFCARTGYESSHAPLYTLLMVYCAFQRKVLSLSMLLLLCYFVHPTNIFLLPLLVAVMTARSIQESLSTGQAIPWRRLVLNLIPPTAVVMGIGLWTIQRPIIQKMGAICNTGLYGPHDPKEFLTDYGRLFLGLDRGSWPSADLLFWSVFVSLVVFGTYRLVRSRQWDRVALVAGALVSAGVLFVVGSSNTIEPGRIRYGYFLIVPTVFAFACLIRALLVPPEGGWSSVVRGLQVTGLLALGGMLLMSHRLDIVNQARVIENTTKRGGESPWTFGSDQPDPRIQAFDFVVSDMERSGERRGMIITTSWMLKFYTRLLALSHPGIEVASLDELSRDSAENAVMKGAYVIECPGIRLGDIERTFPSKWLKRWVIPGRDGIGFISVTHLAREIPLAADFDNDGRVDPAYFRRSDARWIAQLSGGGKMDVVFGNHDLLEYPVPGDYDGDHKLDLAVFRPSTDQWIIRLQDGSSRTVAFGDANAPEIPIQGDYDGDGRTDLAVYIPLTSNFVIPSSNGGPTRALQFGVAEHSDVVSGDFDGDGKPDIAIFLPEKSMFCCLPSGGGPEIRTFMGPPKLSVPAPADYDGDGKLDIAVYLPGPSAIAYRPSKGGEDVMRPFGPARESLIAPGDYDGDGKADLSVYIPCFDTFAYRPSKGGSDITHSWISGGKADIAVSRPSTRK